MLKVCLLLLASAIACNGQCGTPAIPPNTFSRVVGGEEAKPNSWPWQVSLRYSDDGWQYSHFCGGSLLNNQWVVTAAHCVHGKEGPYQWKIWLGAHDTMTKTGSTIEVDVGAIHIYPYFDRNTLSHDVALMKLASPVQFSSTISTVCLPPKLYTSGNGFVTGWGDTMEWGQGSNPRYLQQVMTPIMNRNTCDQRMYPYGPTDESMICAGFDNGQKGACNGDSGGPFVVRNSAGQWELAGIVSWGKNPCAQLGVPSVYANVYYLEPWIQSTMSNN